MNQLAVTKYLHEVDPKHRSILEARGRGFRTLYRDRKGRIQYGTKGNKPDGKLLADPAAIRVMAKANFVEMDCAWQEFSLQLITRQVRAQRPDLNPDEARKLAFRIQCQHYRSNAWQTNDWGFDLGHRCYDGNNADKGFPKMQTVITAGIRINIIGEKFTKGSDKVEYYPFACLDSNKMPPPIDEVWHTDLIFFPKLESRIASANRRDREVWDFSYQGINGIPSYLAMPDGVAYIPAEWFRFA